MKKICAIMIALAVAFTFMPAMDGGMVQAAAKPAKVKITKAVKTNQMVDLKWKKAKRAKKYQIFMKKGKGKWKRIKTVSAKTLKFKKNGLKWNTRYAFKVRAINGKKKGRFSKTYAGKIRTKTTLQKVITATQEKKLRNNFKKLFNEEDFADADITIRGNTIVMYLGLMVESDEVTDADKAALKSSLTTAKMKKDMHKGIIKDQNIVGIIGIKYNLVIRTHDGVTIFDYTYK